MLNQRLYQIRKKRMFKAKNAEYLNCAVIDFWYILLYNYIMLTKNSRL